MFSKPQITRFSIAGSMTLGMLLGAISGPVAAADTSDLANQLQLAATYQSSRFQTANVFSPATGPGVRQGAAWLMRSKNGLRGRIMVNVPTAGDPYSLWIAVFANPSACATSPCSSTDIANPDVLGSVFNGSGAISADNGKGGGVVNIDFSQLAGRLSSGLFVLGGNSHGLLRNKGFKAEVHMVVHQHPPIMPGADSWIADLTTTHGPGGGPNKNVAVGIFAACPASSCPASVM